MKQQLVFFVNSQMNLQITVSEYLFKRKPTQLIKIEEIKCDSYRPRIINAFQCHSSGYYCRYYY